MSAVVTELVWSQSKSCRGSRLVMLALARESDDKGRATLTLEQISGLTQLTARSITKCLGELTKLGELSRERGGGASNPNNYSILLSSEDTENQTDSETELPSTHPEAQREGRRFKEASSQNGRSVEASRKSLRQDWEVSSSRTRGGSTPIGSTTTTKEQASLPKSSEENQAKLQGPVTVPEGAKDLVTAITNAGMLVGWRLTESEWDRVTALAARWGNEQLVEMISRRWNNDRPPQSARYLLRIWADLPSHDPTATPKGNVVPLRRQQPRGWVPFQNTAEPSAYQNGF
ncbi:hypothetical protein [Streptomyces scabiei]|uniref:hypothetical protein n=1 Tax=Streptomyces scabiei TaxID=1930 RepID=UPI0029AF9143|nr:hypothetical protein [Streptomyces scabiei]MDX2531597.1 hypothetical protein [Streptomyces scabiei]MDX2796655.1 hypothetical protein [Streptomyces scabiei]MDX2856162.1 hypothetical protein [Streptomyces scabiei]MDX3824557.1 hypothetical protein [Streptomyces scabiei]